MIVRLLWLLSISICLAARPACQELEAELARLDAGLSDDFPTALAALDARGEQAVSRALRDFGEQDYLARRARARLFQKTAGGGAIRAILPLTGDPDPQVRRLLAEFLGQLRLASEEAAGRVSALVDMLERDSQRFVRLAALDALQKASLPGTAAALDAVMDRVDDELGVGIARALAGLPQARVRVVERVQAAFDPASESRLSAALLARLLDGYGAALAELPDGGSTQRERAAFVLGVTHPSREVQAASSLARDRCFVRLYALGEHERAAKLLEDLAGDGLARHLLLDRGIKLALSGSGDAQHALQQAEALQRASLLAPEPKRESFRIQGLYYSGVARFASGEPALALVEFAQAAQALRASLGERLDLRGPAASNGRSRLRNSLGGAVMVERIQLYASSLLWLALCRLAKDSGPGQPTPAAQVFEWVREAHMALLEARILDLQTDAKSGAGAIDALLESDFSFEGLVLFNRKLEAWTPEQAGPLLERMGRVMATVMPWEFPGFDAFGGCERRLTDPLYDAQRLGLMQRIREEERFAIDRKLTQIQESGVLLGEAGDLELEERQLRMRLRWLAMEEQEEDKQRASLVQAGVDSPNASQLLLVHNALARASTPSLFGLRMGMQLRMDGLPEESRQRGQAVLAALEQGLPGANTVWVEWASSRLEELIGASYMDQERPADAERILLNAVRRLEALENTLESRGAGVDPVQRQRANVLLSLAVNANVRMQDTTRALQFFERAFELDQRDFMQILRACYRARSGLIEEARGVLRAVTPTPQLYYNLACTYALLGDQDLALDYLQRDLDENQPVPGALKRQQLWASKDPDLMSLWEHPRFKRLVASE